MKHLLICGLVLAVVLAACSKKDQQDPQSNQPADKQSCDFGITQFNLTKRAPVGGDMANKRNTQNATNNTTTPPPPPASGVILLDFDGQVVSGTLWNTTGPINCAPANLTSEAVTTIVNSVTNDYSPFNVVVTTDEAVYNAASPYKRTRVIITESWEWYGQAGGVSMLNTFTNGTNTPAFVFSSLLNYNVKNISEAAAHEAGHTFGLRHQSVYSNGVKTSEYNYGQGAGEIGWAPIMGCAYYQNLSLWHKGTSALSATSIQDDEAVIASKVGYKTDDYSNTTSNATALTNGKTGIINGTTDVDFFSLNIATSQTITVNPFNVGAGNQGADIDFVLKVYNSAGSLIATINDPSTLSASTVLNAGNYFISVSNVANPYATTYGMLGQYIVNLN
jgi:hypothetical protein